MLLLLLLLIASNFNKDCFADLLSDENPISIGANHEIKQCKHGRFLYNTHDIGVGNSLRLYGEWSELELEAFYKLISPGDTVFDIGANIGAFSLPLAKYIGKHGVVHAFEAQRILSQNLGTNAALNDIRNIQIHNVAIGKVAGKLRIPIENYTDQRNFGAISFVGNSSGSEFVQVKAIDEMFHIFKVCPTFIKMDIEGMEIDGISGAKKLISRCLPSLYVENNCKKDSKPLIKKILSFGYDLYWDIQPYYNPKNFFNNSNDIFTDGLNMIALHPIVQNYKKIDISGYTQIRDDLGAFWSGQYQVYNPVLNIVHWVDQLGNMSFCSR